MVVIERGTLVFCDCNHGVGMARMTADGLVYESTRESKLVIRANGLVTIQKTSNREMHILVVDMRFPSAHNQ